ncbi:MAG: exodeoxyribonuclease VII small subunit [Clostridiaceae bacterium]|nr:exodeoxyribonuclease VII small subunit [Clostridiaceae bacterium]
MTEEKFVFEKAMKRLDEIVSALEKGDAPLDQSLTLFEEGTGLIRKCGDALDGAEQKLKLLIQTPEGPAFEAFSEEGQ